MAKYYGHKDYEFCGTRQFWIEKMKELELDKLTLIGMKVEYRTEYFWCTHFSEIFLKDENNCGIVCKGYQPRNGKSGRCRFNSNSYEPTNEEFLLKNNKLIRLNNG